MEVTMNKDTDIIPNTTCDHGKGMSEICEQCEVECQSFIWQHDDRVVHESYKDIRI